MDMYKTLYVELYVSALIAIFVYTLYELFNVEKEKEPSDQSKATAERSPAPAIFLPPGIITIGIGLAAFCASAAVGGVVSVINSGESALLKACLITGLLNPFFFAGVPLGIYWLKQSKRSSV